MSHYGGINRRIEIMGNHHMNRTLIPALVVASLIAAPAFAADTPAKASTDKPAASADAKTPAKKHKKGKAASTAKKGDKKADKTASAPATK